MNERKTGCAVTGAGGRMGRHLCRLIADSDEFILAGATENARSDYLGKSVKEALGIPGEEAVFVDSLENIEAPFDVILDFTFPDVSMNTVEFAARERKNAILGSTGFSDVQMEEIKRLSEKFPCVCAPNMSMGVNTLFKLVEDVAKILKTGFDAEVLEIHHHHKKDAPSGTALRIAEILADSYGWDLSQTGVFQRKGFIGERKPEEIGIQTLRAGDVVGEHTVIFGGTGERLELIHRAQSRDCFAQGALYAAKWLIKKPNGFYDMQDVLGLKNS
jgi:4-hydroxy-tetrahydrodipicolinate reductase